jgi:peroxiredoxin
LLDESRAVTKAYGVYHGLRHDALRIASPATLIVDRDGPVRYIYRGDSQTDFAPVEQVLHALRKLR